MRRLAALAAAMAWLSACAARQVTPNLAPGRSPLARQPAARQPPVPLAASEFHTEPQVVGVVHVVRKGETVYRIARAYGVKPADLLEENGIADPRQVAVGTELFVPGASRVVDLAEVTGSAPPAVQRPGTPGTSPAAEPERGDTSNRGRLAWPLKGVLYGRYGVRGGRRHDGIDLSAPEGTRIGAAGPGTVIYAGAQAGYGSIIILRHDGGLVTLYAHCSALLVDEGATVKAGQAIARVGQTGRSSGPHLHFEVREGTRPRNPLLFLP